MKRSVEEELLTIIQRLEKRIAAQDVLIVDLKATIKKLEAKLAKAKKNSSTSSNPPSSDFVKPERERRSRGRNKRKRGGQPGHPKHIRTPFEPDEITQIHQHELCGCPDCGGSLVVTEDDPRVIQQVEVEKKPVRVDEHRGAVYWCEKCQRKKTAPLPPEIVRGGLVGPRLTAIIAYLKGGCHASFSTIRKYVRDVLGVTISRGQLRKLVEKVSKALEQTYNEILEQLKSQRILNVDETGHKEYGKRYWTWCFRAEAFTSFKISSSRGSDVIFDVLGREFDGVLGCDYYSAYRKYMKDAEVLVQFCFAHLIRDVRYLTTLKCPAAAAYGEGLLKGIRKLFRIIHSHDGKDSATLRKKLQRQCSTIVSLAVDNTPKTREVQNMVTRFLKHGHAYFEFITTPGMDPTNNVAEQAIRFVVIDRLVTQGTRSERGRQWCERIWTVMATCAQQGRSAFDFILEAVEANFHDRPAPSLLPQPPPT